MTTSSPSSRPPCRQWDIWQVEWEHEDGTSKARPALAISSSAYNARGGAVWFLKISSQWHNVPLRFDLPASAPGFKATGLTKGSYVYLADVQRLTVDKILYRRGVLSLFTAALLSREIRNVASLTPP